MLPTSTYLHSTRDGKPEIRAPHEIIARRARVQSLAQPVSPWLDDAVRGDVLPFTTANRSMN